MDLYRFFHPYFNPRTAKVPPRLFELEELKQVATLLRLSCERLGVRFNRTSNSKIHPYQMLELSKHLKCIEKILDLEKDSHTGDTTNEIRELVKERANLAGWENWARIITEGLENEKHEERFEELAQVNGPQIKKILNLLPSKK